MRLNGYQIVSESSSDKTHCILLTGLSGSGKSTISERMGKELGYQVIHVDDYIREPIRKKFPGESLLSLETKFGIKKLMEIIDHYQIIFFHKLFKQYKNSKTILEATNIMFKENYHLLDANPDIKLYAIKPLAEEEIFRRRIKRSIEKRKLKGKPPYTEEELKQKRESSRFLYDSHIKRFKQFLQRYKDRVNLISNKAVK